MANFNDWFLKLGFRMTTETPVFVFEQIEFCQMRPISTIRGWVMVRNINRAREKDSMSIIPLDTEKAAKKWLYAVGECGLALCGGVPIMQSMYQCYMRHGVPSKMGSAVAMQTGAKMLARGLVSKSAPISDAARVSVFLAWGITPDEQVALEAYYNDLVLDLDDPRAVDTLEEIEFSPL